MARAREICGHCPYASAASSYAAAPNPTLAARSSEYPIPVGFTGEAIPVPYPTSWHTAIFTKLIFEGCCSTWWWLPEPLVMMSTPARAREMFWAAGVNSSSQVSEATLQSAKASTASPKGQSRCPGR